ncbi:hypothetical protein [Arthrobacter methylotrophus]|uniref:hypothetical protein n=1 Tax=Arthrobacter methylotrophus TaxID=121291 RepID=UPI0031F0D810
MSPQRKTTESGLWWPLLRFIARISGAALSRIAGRRTSRSEASAVRTGKTPTAICSLPSARRIKYVLGS